MAQYTKRGQLSVQSEGISLDIIWCMLTATHLPAHAKILRRFAYAAFFIVNLKVKQEKRNLNTWKLKKKSLKTPTSRVYR